MSHEVLYEERADGVAVLTLNTPERRNALSVDMAVEIAELARAAGQNPTVGALVVTGGEHFCAGADRDVLAKAGQDPAEDQAYQDLETIYGAFTSVGEVTVPTIAAVRGAAVGAGLNLVLATDLRVISRTARLIPGFRQVGVHPGGGHFTLVSRLAGREVASAIGLFGQEVSGADAVGLGLAYAAYDDADVLGWALKLAAQVATDPPLARRVCTAFRQQTASGVLPWGVAVELERPAQMWSLRRRFGRTSADS